MAEALRQDAALKPQPTEPVAPAGGGSKKPLLIAGGVLLGGTALLGGLWVFSGGSGDDADEAAGSTTTAETVVEEEPEQLAAVTDENSEEAGSDDGAVDQADAEPVETAEVSSGDHGSPAEDQEASVDAEAEPEDAGGALEDGTTEEESPPASPGQSSTETTLSAGPEVDENERYGRYRDGKLILIGPVPDQESADQLIAAAGEVLGPENVISEYVIDPSVEAVSSGRIIVDDPVLFNSSSAAIADEFAPLLDLAVLAMALNPQVTLEVTGHTDDRGEEAANQALSLARAESAVEYLVSKGVDPARVITMGAGESEPRVSNDTEAGRSANRRLEFVLLDLIS